MSKDTMVVTAGMYFYGIELTKSHFNKLLKMGMICSDDSFTSSGTSSSSSDTSSCTRDDSDTSCDSNDSCDSDLGYCAIKYKSVNEKFSLICTPHECRWTDIDGNMLLYGVFICALDFGHGKLRIPDLKQPVTEFKKLIKDVFPAVDADYIFFPNDCNCCS